MSSAVNPDELAGPFFLLASFSDSILTFRGPLILEILNSGLEVHAAAPGLTPDSQVGSSLEALGVKVHDVPLSRNGTDPLADLKLALHLYKLFREVRPCTLLTYTVKPVIYGTLSAWLAGISNRYALITGLGYAFTGSRKGMLAGLIQRLYRLALARAHKVFFQNPDDRLLFRSSGILGPAQPSVVVNGSGVDVTSFREQAIPDGMPIFLMIGRLLGDKGVREFVKASRLVRAEHPEARFLLVGWIDSNPDAVAQSELDAWRNDDRIEFLGKLDDVRPAIAASTVYVLPSYREGTPRTVLEAMAMGRPIITTDAPGCRETVTDGDNGFLVPVRSVNALAEAMLKFIEDPTLARRMGRRSRQIAGDKYDVHKVNAVMLREMGIARDPEVKGNEA